MPVEINPGVKDGDSLLPRCDRLEVAARGLYPGQFQLPFIERQAIEIGAVHAGEGLKLIEGVVFIKNMGEA